MKWIKSVWQWIRYSINDVRRYGAVGDGITDDTAAIQNAINVSSIVCIPAGRYLISTLRLGDASIVGETED